MSNLTEIASNELFQTLECGDSERYYILIDASLFEDLLRDVNKVNAFCVKRWLWEGSLLEEHKKNGPLLLSFDEQSDPLLDFFISDMSFNDKGILFISEFPLKTILKHLQQNMFVSLPDNSKAILRIFDPRKLAGVVSSFTDENLEKLFSPLGKVVWWERCFDSVRCLFLDLSTRNYKGSDAGLMVSQDELDLVDKYSAKHFISVMTQILRSKYGLDKQDAENHAITYSREAYSYGIVSERDIRQYVEIVFENTDVINSPTIQSIFASEEPGSKKIMLMKNHIEYYQKGEFSHA